MKIYIKNMVCNRCKMVVQNVFDDMSLKIKNLELGFVETEQPLQKSQLKILDASLKALGFELLEDSAKKQIENIKNLIIRLVADLDIDEDFKLSQFLANKLHKDYSATSKAFSQNEGITLEQYFILQKIEKVKELLLYGEHTLTEIATFLGYKSVQHLSAQFKNITGLTPSAFKKLGIHLRLPLDQIADAKL